MDYSILDVFLIIPLIIGVIRGFMKGFLVEIAMILGLILGVWAGYSFSDFVNDWLKSKYDFEMKIAGFAVCFAAVLIGLYLLAKVLEKMLKLVAMGWLNKIAGAIFGFIKWFLILSVLILFFNRINKTLDLISDEELEKSILYQPISELAPMIIPVLDEIKVDPQWKEHLPQIQE